MGSTSASLRALIYPCNSLVPVFETALGDALESVRRDPFSVSFEGPQLPVGSSLVSLLARSHLRRRPW